MGRTDDVCTVTLEVHTDFFFASADCPSRRRLWHNFGTGSDDNLLADHNLIALTNHRWHHNLAAGNSQCRAPRPTFWCMRLQRVFERRQVGCNTSLDNGGATRKLERETSLAVGALEMDNGARNGKVTDSMSWLFQASRLAFWCLSTVIESPRSFWISLRIWDPSLATSILPPYLKAAKPRRLKSTKTPKLDSGNFQVGDTYPPVAKGLSDTFITDMMVYSVASKRLLPYRANLCAHGPQTSLCSNHFEPSR